MPAESEGPARSRLAVGGRTVLRLGPDNVLGTGGIARERCVFPVARVDVLLALIIWHDVLPACGIGRQRCSLLIALHGFS
jgi:hypothetical protein